MTTLSEWLDYIERQHPSQIELGLERLHEVYARLGTGKPARHVITVAGTNGKGSTVAFIEAIARAAGWRVGSYTSPHLLRYNERVRIDGMDVGDQSLVEAFSSVEAARISGPPVPLTYFEFGTLAALWLFARSGLDLAVLEVGLGGRLDATNLVDSDVAVVTTVDLDHQDWLGHDRERIGYEKAGIARAWKPLVLGEDDPPASVLRHAYAIGASAIRAGCDFFFESLPHDGWRWREVGWQIDLPLPRLAAPVQLRNAATAIAALRSLGRPLPRSAIRQGVADAVLNGRLQAVEREGVGYVLDVAHNPQAAAELARWLRTQPRAGRTHAVYAALGDKDVAGVALALASSIDAWHLAGLEEGGARGLTVRELAARLAGSAAGTGTQYATVAQALDAVQRQAAAGDTVLVFGSFHTVAAALRWLDLAQQIR